MKKILKPVQILSLFLSLGVIAIGCATSAKYDYSKTTDFSGIKTYSWASVTKNPAVDDEAIGFIENEVNALLQEKGLTLSQDKPDFAISAKIGKKEKMRASDFGRNLTPQQLERVQYSEGSLILIFLNPESGAMLWWGVAKADLDKKMSDEKKEKRVRKAVKKLLDKYPPVQ